MAACCKQSVQGLLLASAQIIEYKACDRQAAEFLLMKDDIENLALPTRGLNHRLQRSRLAFLPLDHSAAYC